MKYSKLTQAERDLMRKHFRQARDIKSQVLDDAKEFGIPTAVVYRVYAGEEVEYIRTAVPQVIIKMPEGKANEK